MITIKVDQHKDIDILLLEHALQIRHAGIQGIKESFELDLEEAHVAEFEVNGEYIDFIIKKEQWLTFLEASIEPLLTEEDYPRLVEVRELMRNLSEL